MMDEWISVKERLPKQPERVLTCDTYGNIHIFEYREGSRYLFNIGPDDDRFFEPTHWMPLPEPPKEENPFKAANIKKSAGIRTVPGHGELTQEEQEEISKLIDWAIQKKGEKHKIPSP